MLSMRRGWEGKKKKGVTTIINWCVVSTHSFENNKIIGRGGKKGKTKNGGVTLGSRDVCGRKRGSRRPCVC